MKKKLRMLCLLNKKKVISKNEIENRGAFKKFIFITSLVIFSMLFFDYYYVYLHESAHYVIFSMYGIESHFTIYFNLYSAPYFFNGITEFERFRDESKLTDAEKVEIINKIRELFSLNDIEGYNNRTLIHVIIFSAYIISISNLFAKKVII